MVGELAFVELDRGGGPERLLADRRACAGRGQAARLSPRGWEEMDMERLPILASSASTRWRADLSETVIANGLRIEVDWSDLRPPTFASGPAPRVPTEDIVSVLIEAGSGRATRRRQTLLGRLFRNDVWVTWLGRPLRWGVVAIGEVLLDRP